MLRLTNSEMKDWRRCKRRWFLHYYRELAPARFEFKTPLSIGSRVHDALAAYYVPGLQRGDPIKALKDGVLEDVQEFPDQESKILEEADLCDAMITGYMEWLAETGADAQLEVVAAESAVEAPLIDGATVLSKIDARVNDLEDDLRLALEHKTVQSLKQALPTLQLDTQLLTEHLVEFLNDEDLKTDGALYNMLRKVKRTAQANPPFYGREKVQHNIEELRNHWRHVASVAREILDTRSALDSGQDHQDVCPPNPTKDCSWDCDFFQICALHDDGSDPEPAIADLYVTKDPLERYAEQARIELPEPPA